MECKFQLTRRIDTKENIKEMIKRSSKLVFLEKLLINLLGNGNRVLIFSQSTKMLDLIKLVLELNEMKYLRVDGKTKLKERQQNVDLFNTNTKYFCFLLTTTVFISLMNRWPELVLH
jgi:SNF2 family DNA or RNA helicase